jgi:hypothetical protein
MLKPAMADNPYMRTSKVQTWASSHFVDFVIKSAGTIRRFLFFLPFCYDEGITPS